MTRVSMFQTVIFYKLTGDTGVIIHSFKLKDVMKAVEFVQKLKMSGKTFLINFLKDLVLNLERGSILPWTLPWLHYVSCWIKRSLLFYIWRRRPLDDVTIFYMELLEFFFQRTIWHWAEWPRFYSAATNK